MLWYYEKRLYSELGVKDSGTENYYEVARRALDLRADARAGGDTAGGSLASELREDEEGDDSEGFPGEDDADVSAEPGEDLYGDAFLQSAPGIPGAIDRTQDSDTSGERGRRADSQREGSPPVLPGQYESLADLPKSLPGAIPAILDAAAAYMRSAGLSTVSQGQ